MKSKEFKLSEGDTYLFIYQNEVVLPDGQKKHIFTDPGGTKHLLPYEPYQDYGFKKGEKVKMRVDKINCSGKIFLEPEHPYYREGLEYPFRITGSGRALNIFGQSELLWYLSGPYWEKLTMAVKENTPPPGEEIVCKIVRIRKGKPILSHPDAVSNLGQLMMGEKVRFTVEDNSLVLDSIPYVVLRDPAGNKHLLKSVKLEGKVVRVGENLICEVVRWSTKGQYILDPC